MEKSNKLNKIFLSNKNSRKSVSGITLIALIITIIVLLILAGVTIAAITSNESAPNKAVQARTENDKGAMKDSASLLATNFIQEYYDKVYVQNDSAFRTNYANAGAYAKAQFPSATAGGYTYAVSGDTLTVTDSKGNSVVATIGDNGNISWGEISANVPKLNVKVGDVISYAPSGTYEWNKEYAEDDGNGSITLSSAEGEAFNITTWKVLTVDNNGNIEIVPTKKGRYYDSNIEEKDGDILGETTGKVTLKGAQGYNNGVKLLNEACNSLYGNGSNIKGRSLNIEDIEKAIKASGNEEALNTAKGLGYPKQVKNPFVSNDSDYPEYAYPSIYADEKLSVINDKENRNTSALNLSQEPGDFIEKNEDGTGYTKTLSMQPYITYYYLQYSNLLNNTYRSILGQLDLNESYHCWLASRSIWTDDGGDYCEFLISYLCSYCTYDHYQYLATSSGYDSYDQSFSICPVVSLNLDDLEKSNIQGIDFCVK